MAAPQPNLMDAWRTWNAYHRQVPKDFDADFTNKIVKRRFWKKISTEWKKIGTRYPAVHTARKLDFRRCVMRLERSRAAVLRAVATREAQDVQNDILNLDNQPEPQENVLQAKIQELRALKNLVRIERSVIKEPADLIRHWDERRMRRLKDEIQTIGHGVLRVRNLFEGQVPKDADEGTIPPRLQLSRTGYQGLPQGRNVDPHPGGRMFHFHLRSSRATSAGLWILSDANNNVVDRVVVKDCWVPNHDFPQDWTDRKFWLGDRMDPTTKQPMEAVIHAKLSHDESILHMRSWHMHAHKLMYRVGPCISNISHLTTRFG